jgi:hypothetical protein
MLPVFAQPCHAWRMKRVVIGPVAQWSELAAHNRLVGGSSPPGPTILILCLLFLSDLEQKLSSAISMLDKNIGDFVHHPFSISFAIASRAMRLRSAALV